MMGVWNARLLDDSLHKALYGRGKALYQSTHHYKDFGLLGVLCHGGVSVPQAGGEGGCGVERAGIRGLMDR